MEFAASADRFHFDDSEIEFGEALMEEADERDATCTTAGYHPARNLLVVTAVYAAVITLILVALQ